MSDCKSANLIGSAIVVYSLLQKIAIVFVLLLKGKSIRGFRLKNA